MGLFSLPHPCTSGFRAPWGSRLPLRPPGSRSILSPLQPLTSLTFSPPRSCHSTGITSNSKPYYDHQAWHHLPLSPSCLQPTVRGCQQPFTHPQHPGPGPALALLYSLGENTTQIVPNFPPSAAQSSVRKASSHAATSRCKFSMANTEWPPLRVPCTSVSHSETPFYFLPKLTTLTHPTLS